MSVGTIGRIGQLFRSSSLTSLAYVDLWFSNGAYVVNGVTYGALSAIPGFTFTRASLAMGYDATGKLTYAPNNLATFSQAFDNAAWTKTNATVSANATSAPDGTTTADTLIEDTSTGGHLLNRTITTGAAAPLCYSVYVKAGPGSRKYRLEWFDGGSYIWRGTFDPSNDTFSTITTPGLAYGSVSVGGGWYRIYMVAQPGATGTSQQLLQYLVSGASTSYTGDGTSGIYLWGAQLEAVTYQTTPSTYYPTTSAAYYGPRLVYDPVTLAAQGILVEEARTNVLTQSQDFATTWTLGGSTVTTNNTTSPDGTTNADKLVEDSAAAAEHRCFNTFTGVSGTTYTYSVYAKADTRGGINIRMQATGTPIDIYYDVSTGAVTSTTAGTGSIQSVGNGWYRCIATGVSDLSGSVRITINLLQTAGGTTRIYTGDGTSGLFLWQAQIEAGTGASSPIPTTTASVTRAADVAVVTGLALSYPMTVAVEAYRGLDKATDEFWVQVDDGTSGNRVVLQVTSSDKLEAAMTTGGAGQGSSISAASVTVGATSKAAARFATNSIEVALNGTLSPEDTTATTPSGPANLRIGSNQSGQGQPMYPISRIRIYNRALSDAELQALTA